METSENSDMVEPMGDHTHHIDHVDVVKKVHADGTVDMVDTHAIGGEFRAMPHGYYRSAAFLGTYIVSE